jgi:hypothetical protein
MSSVTALLCSLQILPSSGAECMSINMSTFCVSFHTMAVKLHLTLFFVTPLQINFISKILQHLFSNCSNSPAAVYCLTMLSDFDENKLSIYNLFRKFSILAVSSVTVARVAVMEGVTRFLSLFTAVFIAL